MDLRDGSSEQDRLRALHETGLLDTPADPRFDRYTRLASALTGAPIALISLIDANRQWFKSCVGLGESETPREYAFCDYAIRQSGVLVIPDATADPRFAGNPLVTAAPNIRFYAGAPLVLQSGHAIGTLCIIDTVPRAGLSDQHDAALRDLASLVVDEIQAGNEARSREIAISELQHRIGNLFAQVAGLMTLALSNGQSKEQYVSDLRDRVDALNQLNRQLAKRDWVAGQLSEIVLAAILPVIGGRDDRIDISGAQVDVNAKAAMTISLALSELAVNSIKHGALGASDGRARIEWTMQADRFVLTWEETGKISVEPADVKPGFGSRLLTRIAPRDLGGDAVLDINDGRLAYTLSAPLAHVS
jgi:two-component sensor histidine kinase